MRKLFPDDCGCFNTFARALALRLSPSRMPGAAMAGGERTSCTGKTDTALAGRHRELGRAGRRNGGLWNVAGGTFAIADPAPGAPAVREQDQFPGKPTLTQVPFQPWARAIYDYRQTQPA